MMNECDNVWIDSREDEPELQVQVMVLPTSSVPAPRYTEEGLLCIYALPR